MVRLIVAWIGLLYLGVRLQPSDAFFWNWILTNPHALSLSQSDSIVRLSNHEPFFDAKSSIEPTTIIYTTIQLKSEDQFIGHPKRLRDIATPEMDFTTTTVLNQLGINQVFLLFVQQCSFIQTT